MLTSLVCFVDYYVVYTSVHIYSKCVAPRVHNILAGGKPLKTVDGGAIYKWSKCKETMLREGTQVGTNRISMSNQKT